MEQQHPEGLACGIRLSLEAEQGSSTHIHQQQLNVGEEGQNLIISIGEGSASRAWFISADAVSSVASSSPQAVDETGPKQATKQTSVDGRGGQRVALLCTRILSVVVDSGAQGLSETPP
jgi:hypothetical protein